MKTLSRLDAGFLTLVDRLLAAFMDWFADPDNRVLNKLADWLDRIDDVVEDLAQRWEARPPVVLHTTHTGAHRLVGPVRPFDRADYEWGQAIAAMAARREKAMPHVAVLQGVDAWR